MSYFKQDKPFMVPTTDGKLIEEHIGNTSTGDTGLSIAHMVALAGWSEPFQNPRFDEYTLVCRGKKLFEVDGEHVLVSTGQSICIKADSRVRYSNPNQEECEYWSIAFRHFQLNQLTGKKVKINILLSSVS